MMLKWCLNVVINLSFICFDLVLAIFVPDSTSGVRHYLSSHKFTLAILAAFMP